MILSTLLKSGLLALIVLLHASVAKETSFWENLAALKARAARYHDAHYDAAHHDAATHHDPADHHASPHHASTLHQRRDASTSSDAAPSSPSSSNPSLKCTTPMPRVSFYTLTATEQSSWISSFRSLSNRGHSIFISGGSFMDDLALVHIGLQEEMHYNACFLPCHTAFLRMFYSMMRVVGYRGREAYWDIESDYRGGIQNAPLWGIFGGGAGGPISTGPFRGLTCGVLPNTRRPGYSIVQPHPVTRHFNGNWSNPNGPGDMYTSHFNNSLYSTLLSSPTYTTLRQTLERTVHAWIHQAIGGEMWLFSAPCEPVFWLLHAEIDRYWRSWQRKRGRWDEYGGHKKVKGEDGKEEVRQAGLGDEVDFYGLVEAVSVEEVMHPRRGIMCMRYDSLVGGEADDG